MSSAKYNSKTIDRVSALNLVGRVAALSLPANDRKPDGDVKRTVGVIEWIEQETTGTGTNDVRTHWIIRFRGAIPIRFYIDSTSYVLEVREDG